jgi:quercetin dioxygenase-like cupin family protein
MAIKVFHRDRPSVRLPMISSDARLLVWPGVGAWNANMNYVRMRPGEQNVAHVHRASEDTIYVLEGLGTIQDLDNEAALEFGPGQVVHVPPGVRHQVRADRGETIVSVGGPCPADREMLVRSGLLDDTAQPHRR